MVKMGTGIAECWSGLLVGEGSGRIAPLVTEGDAGAAEQFDFGMAGRVSPTQMGLWDVAPFLAGLGQPEIGGRASRRTATHLRINRQKAR